MEAVKAIHADVLAADGGSTGLRDGTLLESAVAAPQAAMMGQPVMTDPLEVAAAYLFYLCRNHAFVDGNKRVALAACLMFLDQSNLLSPTELDTDPWEEFVLDIASSKLDRGQTTARLRELVAVS